MKKKIIVGLIFLFVVIQFFRPSKNEGAELITANDISKRYTIPENVHELLIQKCYDCHSNKTNYPWYVNIQPIGWWMAHHVDEGKGELNFSEFKTYDEKRAQHKMHEIEEQIEEGEMPLTSYTVLHQDAKLSESDHKAIDEWIESLGLPKEESHH